MSADPVHHSPVEVFNPGGRRHWTLYASRTEPARLIVFVHGFGGRAVKTWHEFAYSGDQSEWWRRSDMLFVGYESLRERPGETAAWIRRRLSYFYPVLPTELLQTSGAAVRVASGAAYRELFLVGHSLGGFILRLALLQQARKWLHEDGAGDPLRVRPHVLDGTLRLFSPANAGFKPAGLLALLSLPLPIAYAALDAAPAFRAMRGCSDLLIRTREETEGLVGSHTELLSALRARILWANPEQVVEREGYRTDFEAESLVPRRDHMKVCKPNSAYAQPLQFVETGQHS